MTTVMSCSISRMPILCSFRMMDQQLVEVVPIPAALRPAAGSSRQRRTGSVHMALRRLSSRLWSP